MVCYIRGKFTKDFKWLYLRLLLYYESSVPKMGIFKNSYLLFVFTIMCVVTSDAQNLELLEKVEN